MEQDSQRVNTHAPCPSRKKSKKKNDRTLRTSSEREIEKPPDNDDGTSISDVETQSGNEHSPSDNEKYNDVVHEDSQRINTDAPSPSNWKTKNKNDGTLHSSSEPEIEKPPEANNDVYISDV